MNTDNGFSFSIKPAYGLEPTTRRVRQEGYNVILGCTTRPYADWRCLGNYRTFAEAWGTFCRFTGYQPQEVGHV